MFAVRRHFALFTTRKPVVLKGLIRSNHGLIFKQQMVDLFSFHLLLEQSERVLSKESLGLLVGFGKRISGFGKLKFIRLSIALIPRTLMVTPNSRLIHSATNGRVQV